MSKTPRCVAYLATYSALRCCGLLFFSPPRISAYTIRSFFTWSLFLEVTMLICVFWYELTTCYNITMLGKKKQWASKTEILFAPGRARAWWGGGTLFHGERYVSVFQRRAWFCIYCLHTLPSRIPHIKLPITWKLHLLSTVLVTSLSCLLMQNYSEHTRYILSKVKCIDNRWWIS